MDEETGRTVIEFLFESYIYFIGAFGGLLVTSIYLNNICEVPRLVSGNKAFQKALISSCPTATQVVRPPLWCFSAIPQVIFTALRPARYKVPFVREVFGFSDGGECALDWYPNLDSSPSVPVLIILPGLVGSSEEFYAQRLSRTAANKNGRCVVFNYRGVGGVSLKSAKTYCATYTQDIHEVVMHVKQRYPDAPVMACGISLGGMILFNYVAGCGSNCALTGAVVISPPWDTFQSTSSLESHVYRFLFNHRLAAGLIARARMHRDVFTDVLVMEDVEKSVTIRDFDRSFVVPMFGYPDLHAYYSDASIGPKVHKVAIPLLAIAAEDDPFAPGESLPLEAIEDSDHVCMFLLKRGSHIAFLNGVLWPDEFSVADRLVGEFFVLATSEECDFSNLLNLNSKEDNTVTSE